MKKHVRWDVWQKRVGENESKGVEDGGWTSCVCVAFRQQVGLEEDRDEDVEVPSKGELGMERIRNGTVRGRNRARCVGREKPERPD